MEEPKFQGYVLERLDKIYTKVTQICVASAEEKQKLKDHLQGHNRTWVYIGILAGVISTGITLIGLIIKA